MTLYDLLVVLSPPSQVAVWVQGLAVLPLVAGVGMWVWHYAEEDR